VIRVAVVVAGVLVLAAPGAGTGGVGGIEAFRTPSRNIACGFFPSNFGAPTLLRCDILSGLKPEPRRRCDGDWTGASIRLTGRANAVCAGDTVYDPRSRILGYGKTWRRAGLRCTSRSTGLTCTNRSGHGFFLSRQRWRVF
jgi:hypothetical protein